MNKNLFKLITLGCIISICLICTSTTYAQTPWTLEQCVNYALENNITLKQQQLNVNYNENQLKQSKFDLAPNLNGSVGYNYNFGKTLTNNNTYSDKNSSNIDFGINSEVRVFNAFAKQNTIKKRDLELKSVIQDLEKAKDDIALAIAQAYLEILFNKELVSTSKEQISITHQQLDYNKKQVDAGNLARGKILETEAQLSNEELTLTTYENQLQLSLINLVQLIELPVSDTFDIVIPTFDSESLSLELLTTNALYNKAVAERPEIISKEFKMQSAEKDQLIAKAQLYPYLVAGASYNTNYNNTYAKPVLDPVTSIPVTDPITTEPITEKIPFSEQLNKNRRGAVYLSLRIPIFNGWSAKTNEANAKINYENSQLELQLTKNNLLKEIQQVHANASAAMKKYYSSEKAVTSAKEAFRYVEEKFNLGIVTPLEYNDAKNRVTNAQSSFIQAKYEYIFRIKILDFYNGKEITL